VSFRVLLWIPRIAFASLLQTALQKNAKIGMTRHVTSARQYRAEVRSGKWHVALVDPGNPVEDVFPVVLAASARGRRPAVVFLADTSAPGWILRGMSVGASGFLGKCARLPDILKAIECAYGGQRFLSPCCARVVLDSTGESGRSRLFTKREQEVLERTCDGKSTKEIARDLGISAKTIDVFRTALMRKSGTKNAAQLVRWSCNERFVDPRSCSEPRDEQFETGRRYRTMAGEGSEDGKHRPHGGRGRAT